MTTAAPPAPDEKAERAARKEARLTPRADVRRSEKAQELITSPAMRKALELEDPIIWPDKAMKFMAAESVEAIAQVLIRHFHRDIRDYKILFLFREKMKSRDRTTLGKASKADPKLAYYTEATFVMEINHNAWIFAPADAKVALVDHELAHFNIDVGEKGEKEPVLVHHDIEEFSRIIERWGLWKNDVKSFAASVQLALPFEAAAEAQADAAT